MSAPRRVAGRPTWLLSRANARSQALLMDAFADHGVRGYHFRMLAALDENGPSSQADLGRNTGIDRSDVVAALNEMAARELVRRDPDPNDGRRNVIRITPWGLETLERLDDMLNDVQDEVLAPLTANERTTLVRLLTKLA